MLERFMTKGIGAAVGAALLFGLSTPLAKILVGDIHPIALAGWLYAGSGIGLLALIGVRQSIAPSLLILPKRADVLSLAGAIFFGGICGPILLMFGLRSAQASTASLLLNLEGALTALLAWLWFRENLGGRIALGMTLVVIGGIVLTWSPGSPSDFSLSSLLIIFACLCWAIDNNLTRNVSAGDPLVIACTKGLVAGVVNLAIAYSVGEFRVDQTVVGWAAVVGFIGYGLSIALFVIALRDLGAARTGAYFSLAPFFGAALALAIGGEAPSAQLIFASAVMAVGVWLHLTENHSHRHAHTILKHSHSHRHDEHHQHTHKEAGADDLEHTHPHTHDPLTHSHQHFPDIHHRHSH